MRSDLFDIANRRNVLALKLQQKVAPVNLVAVLW